MASLNKVFILGNVTRDPELRYTPQNTAVCTIGMALNGFKKADGTQDTTFVNVVAWKQTAENCSKYLSKGDPILVEGRLQSRQWQDQEGKNRSVLEIVASNVQFLRSRNEAPQEQSMMGATPQAQEATEMFDDSFNIPGE